MDMVSSPFIAVVAVHQGGTARWPHHKLSTAKLAIVELKLDATEKIHITDLMCFAWRLYSPSGQFNAHPNLGSLCQLSSVGLLTFTQGSVPL
jgi:hypothetical protein